MRTVKLALVSLLLGLAACTHGGRLATPAGFADLGSDAQHSYRATSARGVVVATRTEDNDVAANTAFWAEALDLRLKAKGYVAESSKPVRTRRGLDGTELHYTTTVDGRPQRYWLAVFATAKRVYVVEAGGDQEVFDPSAGVVEETIASLDATP
jgi:hypothetical protein